MKRAIILLCLTLTGCGTGGGMCWIRPINLSWGKYNAKRDTCPPSWGWSKCIRRTLEECAKDELTP